MEFGSLGPGTPAPAANAPTVGTNPAQSATLATNPENVVTPSTKVDTAENDLRRDGAATNGLFSGRRTTLAFDSEQNRIFLQIIDDATDEVIEQIPSEKLVALIEDSVSPPRKISSQKTDEPGNTNPPV